MSFRSRLVSFLTILAGAPPETPASAVAVDPELAADAEAFRVLRGPNGSVPGSSAVDRALSLEAALRSTDDAMLREILNHEGVSRVYQNLLTALPAVDANALETAWARSSDVAGPGIGWGPSVKLLLHQLELLADAADKLPVRAQVRRTRAEMLVARYKALHGELPAEPADGAPENPSEVL